MLKLKELTVNYLENPIGIDIEKPEFSWKLVSDEENTRQTAYRIIVGDVWNSGRVESDSSVFVKYDGGVLKPKTRYDVCVTVWDNNGESAEISGYFETGLMSWKNWKGRWITNFDKDGYISVFRKEFSPKKKIKKARIYATALGVYEIHINGVRVSDTYLAPGFTAVHMDVLYQTYDVTDMLGDKNAICIAAASGWAMGAISRGAYGLTEPAALMQLDVEYEDGTEDGIYTDYFWKCFDSPWTRADIYNGETYDARLFDKSLYMPDCDESKLKRVVFKSYPYMQISGQRHESVKRHGEIAPIELITTPKGERVIDFGQNLTGVVHFAVSGKSGDRVVFDHAEVLDKDGNFYTANMRKAQNLIEYTLRGGEKEEFEPTFTFQGFRYIRLIEYPGDISLNDFKAYPMHTDYKKTAEFECSDNDLNQLYKNVLWGQDDNFVDVPTDCPQRDERMGWTGDAQVFIKTAAINRNVGALFNKWLRDAVLEQPGNGEIMMVVPRMSGEYNGAAWGDAITICPLEVYRAYGDKTILADKFEGMERWVEYIKAQGENPYLWNTGHQFGDWLGLDAEEGSCKGKTDKFLIATAYYAVSCHNTAMAAEILGYTEKAKYYNDLYKNIKAAFADEYLNEDGTVKQQTQTANALVLYFDLTDNKTAVAADLAKLVEDNGKAMTTGFVGTPYIIYALSDNGYASLAYDLVLRREFPSWLYSVSMGATTIWEHWDGLKPDGSMWSEKMNSFTHYAYGAVASWFFTDICGIKYTAPGYKAFEIKPVLDERLSFANAAIDTMYGKIRSQWRKVDGGAEFEIEVPSNTTCRFEFNGTKHAFGSGIYKFTVCA